MILTNRQKRVVKRVVKKMESRKPKPVNIEGLLIHRETGDYDSENHTFLMKASGEDEAIKKLERRFPVYGIENVPSAYDCTGRPFCEPAYAKQVAPDRYLIHLHISYDV